MATALRPMPMDLVDHGPLPSTPVAVAKGGRLVAFETYGDATPTSRYILQSVGRVVVAAAAWKLLDDGPSGPGSSAARRSGCLSRDEGYYSTKLD